MIIENKPIKILTIEDDRSVRESFVAHLEDCGYIAIAASNGKLGVELFYKENPDLVMVDLRMPEIDGLEVLKDLSGKFPEVPLIVISGTGVITDAIEALHSGAWDYILKPVEDMSMLTYAIEKALDKSRLQRENREYRTQLEKLVDETAEKYKDLHDTLSALGSDLREKLTVMDRLIEGISQKQEPHKDECEEMKRDVKEALGLAERIVRKLS